jgi:hypothetical protein
MTAKKPEWASISTEKIPLLARCALATAKRFGAATVSLKAALRRIFLANPSKVDSTNILL